MSTIRASRLTMALLFLREKPPRPKASAADVGILRLVAELRDAPHDDGVHAQQFSEFRRRGGIGAVAIREILLGQDLIKSLALDDRIGAVLHQVLYEQVRDTLADVDVLTEQRRRASLHRAEIEIEDGDALLAPLGLRRRAGRCGRGRCSPRRSGCRLRICAGRSDREKSRQNQRGPQDILHDRSPAWTFRKGYAARRDVVGILLVGCWGCQHGSCYRQEQRENQSWNILFPGLGRPEGRTADRVEITRAGWTGRFCLALTA
jgi:hypothetical protein